MRNRDSEQTEKRQLRERKKGRDRDEHPEGERARNTRKRVPSQREQLRDETDYENYSFSQMFHDTFYKIIYTHALTRNTRFQNRNATESYLVNLQHFCVIPELHPNLQLIFPSLQ